MAISRSRLPIVRAVRTPEALDALRDWLDSFDGGARQRGRNYYQTGAVGKVWSDADHLVKAEVRGGDAYAVTLFHTRGAWASRCTCPVGIDCKHVYATGLAWLATVESGVRDGRDPAEIAAQAYLPAKLPPTAPTPAPPSGTRAAEEEIARWLRALPSPDALAATPGETSPFSPGPLAEIAGLRVRLHPDGAWIVETRASADKPWKAAAKRVLIDLARTRPADFAAWPAADAALASTLAAELRLGLHSHAAKLAPIAVRNLLRTPAALAAVVRPDASPFAIEPEPLVLDSRLDEAAPDRLALSLLTPDGRDANAARLVAEQPRPLYLFEGLVWRGPPPLPAASLPLAALDDARLLPRLRAAGLRLAPGLVADSKIVALRPRLRCWLSPVPGSEDRDFHAQLGARSEDPPCERIWTGNAGWRWAKNAEPPPRAPGAPLHEFDLGAAHAAATALAGLRLVWENWAEQWSRPATDAFPDEFLAWHAALPPGLDVDLSPELAGLFGAPLQANMSVSLAAAPGSDQDWFDLSVGLNVDDARLTAEEIALLLKARGKWVRLPRHGWKRLDSAPRLDPAAAAALDRLGIGVDDVAAAGRGAKHRLHALQLALEAEALVAHDNVLGHALQDRARRLAATPPAPLPENLRAELRPYQKEGYQFLCHLSAQGFGGVLADDMGLGKTVQTLAWLLHLSNAPERSGTAEPFRALVICPKSVTHGWLVEAARFAPGLSIAAFSPAPAARPALAAANVVVANYTQLRLNAARFRAETWDAVVLDEGQFIKNPGSQVAVSARSLRARRRLVLTGTPIENRLSDLWSLFAFAQPGLLGDQAGFRRQYPEEEPAALARLHRRVQHFLLRRTKAQAAPDLPARTEDEIVVGLEGEQRRLYDAELKRARAQLLGVETRSALDAVRFHVLASLLRLRQICCHPALVDPAHAGLPSAKLDALMERVEELAEEGHQVLVFSQFVEMLEIIRQRLVAAGIGHLILTGATENRAELVDAFQTDKTKTVFLLSLKAAGFGLNLTAASYAFLYDPWWNPAAEAQAIDRIHRIGQTKPVIAYRLLAEGTVEEKIRLLQREKAALAAAVVHEESLATVLDLESLRRVLA
jgi:superfamily II DNA or RNA helicase